MNQRNDLVWTPGRSSETGEWEAHRTARRNTTSPNSYDSRILCEQECDRRNSGYERPSPLILIPDRTLNINPLT